MLALDERTRRQAMKSRLGILSMAKSVVGWVSERGSVLRAESALDQFVALRVRSRRRAQTIDGPSHLLVPTVGSGNIGDQAMLESYLQNTAGLVTMVLQAEGSLVVPREFAARVSSVVLPRLFQGDPVRRLHDRNMLVDLIAQHDNFSVVGADIMDGGYSRRESVLRFSLLRVAARLGRNATLLGFSWNGDASNVVVAAARRTARVATLCVRDPLSKERLEAAGVSGVRLVADTVFALNACEEHPPTEEWLSRQSAVGRPVLVVNASGLLRQKEFLFDEYLLVIHHLLRRGVSVLLLPHVIRQGDDDLISCRRLQSEFSANEHVCLVDTLLSPGQVSEIARVVRGVLTARMHLSILAMNQGVPATVVSTQGKVEGMLALFGLQHLALTAAPGMASSAADALDAFIDGDADASQIRANLATVRELALRNFDSLGEPSSEVPDQGPRR